MSKLLEASDRGQAYMGWNSLKPFIFVMSLMIFLLGCSIIVGMG